MQEPEDPDQTGHRQVAEDRSEVGRMRLLDDGPVPSLVGPARNDRGGGREGAGRIHGRKLDEAPRQLGA